MSDCGCSREGRGFEEGFEREGRNCEFEERREVRNVEFEDRRGEFNHRRGCRCLANNVERLIRDIRRDARTLECEFERLEDRGCIRRSNNWDNWDNWDNWGNGCNSCGCNRCHRCNRCNRCNF